MFSAPWRHTKGVWFRHFCRSYTSVFCYPQTHSSTNTKPRALTERRRCMDVLHWQDARINVWHRDFMTECVEYCQHVLRAKSRMTCFSVEAKSLYELRHLSSSAPLDMALSHWVTMDDMQQVKLYIYIVWFYLETFDIWEKASLSRSALSPPPSPRLPLSLHISPSFLLVNWQQLTSQLSLDLMAWTVSSKQVCEQRSFQRGKIER